ncbi:MAG: peptidylprolyl isomerase [Pseudomonadota bacterium]
MRNHGVQGCLSQAAFLLLGLLFYSSVVHAQDQIERTMHLDYDSPVLATRGEAAVTMLEMDARMAVIPDEHQSDVIGDPERLEALIESQLQIIDFSTRAIEAGMLDDEVVRAQLYMMVSAWLAEQYRNRAFAAEELDDYTDQARETYLLNPDRFQTESTISFTHLLVAAADDAEQRASEYLARVHAGESLTNLAVEFSEDPSVRTNQGQFSEVGRDMLETRFRAGLEDLQPGEIELIESGFGWHVVRMDDIHPGRLQTFEEVEPELTEEARNRHRAMVAERLLREHFADPLIIVEGGVADVLDRFAPSP